MIKAVYKNLFSTIDDKELDDIDFNLFLRPKHIKTIYFLTLSLVLLILITAIYIVLTINLYSFQTQYDTNCSDQKQCSIEFYVKQDIPSKLYFFYHLKNFYQNHRQIYKSYDIDQLYGKHNFDTYQTYLKNDNGCTKGSITNRDMGKTHSFTGKPLDPNKIAIPCGALAKTLFNDTFKLTYIGIDRKSNQPVPLNNQSIAWKIDIENIRNTPYLDQQWLDMQNPHFQVWIRPAATDEFSKIYGVIENGLKKGYYKVDIQNNFDYFKKFKVQKLIQIKEVKYGGSKNTAIIVCSVILVVINVLTLIIFIYLYKKD